MILVSREEVKLVREKFPHVHIMVVNKQHKSRAKRYYMTAEKEALYKLCETNSSARKELVEILKTELKFCRDSKKRSRLAKEIKNLAG